MKFFGIVSFIALFSVIAVSQVAFSAEDKIIYYSGTEVQTSLFGQPQVIEELVLAKSILPSKNLITEVACVKAPNAPAIVSPVYMTIENSQISKISDSADFKSEVLKGTGILDGEFWNWNYLKFSMTYAMPSGVSRIEDENWVSGKYLVAIKEIYWKDNKAPTEMKVALITAKVQEVSKSEYEARWKQLGCPAIP